ncbi:MAG: hypothetical protein FJ279_32745 [Planctomycetes bacterium]|nr:hypothetical protein [Planctomycetota bacterium]
MTNDIATPIPVCLLDDSQTRRQVTLHLELPGGVEVVGGGVGEARMPDVPQEPSEAGGKRYKFTTTVSGKSALPWGRLYVRASPPHRRGAPAGDLKHGEMARVSYWTEWAEGRSPKTTLPVRAVTLPPTPRLKRMMLALGWWSLADTRAWPEGLRAAEAIGLNTLSTFTMWMKPDEADLWNLAEEGRKQGFKLLNVDSTWHRMMERHKKDAEVYCQLADGKHGERMCPSYRGRFYAEELQRVASQCARLRPDYLSTDVELWNWRGPVDAEKCARCQADKEKSGLADWAEWRLQKGFEMWRDLHEAVQKAASKSVEMGCYDWRPGKTYQFTWPFDRLYPKHLHNSQPSTYTPLEPWHIELVGNEAREDRSKLPKSDVLPWLTPGDAGAFPGEALRCAMLECFLNGARGIHFWSSRYWDTEYLVAYNQAVRAVAAVEDIIVDGTLYDGAKAEPPARVSGMIRGNDLALLVGEYYGSTPTTVNVTLAVPAASEVVDAETGTKLGEVEAGQARKLEVKLGEHRSRVLWLRPR